MKLDSDLFDSIRIKRGKDDGGDTAADAPPCQYAGCDKPGRFRAPKGRGREGEFFQFCVDHVREYNKRYNYFAGMSDEELAEFREDSLTGHRPTWTVGANSWARGTGPRPEERPKTSRARPGRVDPHGLFGGDASRKGRSARRALGTIERRCLHQLELDQSATADDIKKKYKDLVKRHHPDANGGDRASEDKLREVIQAYNYLKQVGLC